MAKKIPLSNPSLSQLRENSRKASTGGPGSYANTDLAKQRNANFKQSVDKNAAGVGVKRITSLTVQEGFDKGKKYSVPKQFQKSMAGLLKGEPGAAKGASGKDGGNPCHDSEGKFC